jgi:glycosyltransferase involved in cell wall biosynthesis
MSTPKKIALITDAWHPQVNGVVQTLNRVTEHLKNMGHQLEIIQPQTFHTLPCPSYPEVPLAIFPSKQIRRRLEKFNPDHVHIATEGPLGICAWRYCSKKKWAFTTAFHTQFPEYLHHRCRFPLSISYALIRWFHNSGSGTMVSTSTIQKNLRDRGFQYVKPWCRGVAPDVFKPGPTELLDLPKPIHLYVGRVAVEKNIDAFLAIPLQGSKVVIGSGPALAQLQQKFPEVHFLGKMQGQDLVNGYASADVFVFPSKTDTYGLVMLESLACGTPVAAYPVQGPLDVITDPSVGSLNSNLKVAIEQALTLKRDDAIRFAQQHSWGNCAQMFFDNLVPKV